MKLPLYVEIFRAYLVLLWFLGGAFLLVAALPQSARPPILTWSAEAPFWVYAPFLFIIAFLFSPMLVFLVPINAVPSFLQAKDYGSAAIELLVPVVFYFLWWLAWYILYGRPRTKKLPTPSE